MSRKRLPPNAIQGRAQELTRTHLSKSSLRNLARAALEEDIGPGDVTSAIFSGKEMGRARFLAKQDGTLSGTAIADAVFSVLSPSCRINWHKQNGDRLRRGDIIAEIRAPLAILFQGERVVLNFLQRLSGIATLTRKFVETLGSWGPQVQIFDTRKTTPLLRALEKQAVVDGGGSNHRFALYDMAMLKNNHIDAAGGVEQAVARLELNGFFTGRNRLPFCIEARNLTEAALAAKVGADIVLLDNMTPAQIRKTAKFLEAQSVNLKQQMPQLEISGGMTLARLRYYRNLPVQRISVGSLTHSAPALDIAMHFLL